MKSRKAIALAFSLLIIASFVLAACTGNPTPANNGNNTVVEPPAGNNNNGNDNGDDTVDQPDVVVPDEVVNYGYSTTDIPTLDPQLGEDVVSINYVENLFVHLTNYDLDTAEVVPEAATSWTVSDDGLVYTFTVRTDIPWVNYNPVTGETTQEVDEEGNPRFVTAYDFQYGIRRACDPSLGSYYSSIIAPNIAGCADVFEAEAPGEEDFANIGATALDESTLEILLAEPVGFFLSMTPMWPLAAVPQWAIEEHGDNWTEAGFIVTSGRYTLAEWVHGVRRIIVRNPLMPADMAGSGNIDRFETNVVPDTSTGYALWLAGEVETAAIPDEELANHLETYADETDQIADLAVFYFGFNMDAEPFDNQDLRAAFSAAFDRATFIDTVRQGQGLPMKHFAPPGIFGAPPLDEVGVGFDVEYAQQKMVDAGYPNCEGLPTFTLLGYSGQSTLNWIEFAQNNWSENLGCDPEIIQIEQLSFSELLAATKPDNVDRPNMWTLGWGPDYADEHNWVHDVLLCDLEGQRMNRPCEEVDDLIHQAKTETDPAVRVELYAEIEEQFFGEDGIFPMAPLYLRIAFQARHSWLDRVPSLFGGEQWYNWSLDAASRAEMMGN